MYLNLIRGGAYDFNDYIKEFQGGDEANDDNGIITLDPEYEDIDPYYGLIEVRTINFDKLNKQYHFSRQNNIAFLENQAQHFPDCEVRDYLDIKLNILTYESVKSNRQISTIVKFSKNPKYGYFFKLLLELFMKHVSRKNLFELLKGDLKDKEIYKKLILKNKNRKEKDISLYTGEELYCDGEMRTVQIIKYVMDRRLPPEQKIKNYLDIGCGDCIKSKLLGNLLGLDDANIYGADIPHWSAFTEEKRKKVPINFIEMEENKPLPVANNKFDLVSTLMVLHHVRDLKFFLNEINRIVKSGGYFIVKEHDALTTIDYMLADIEHGIYSVAYHDNYDNFVKEHYAQYYDWIEWDRIILKFGFKFIAGRPLYGGLTARHWSPTRGFFAIYQKI